MTKIKLCLLFSFLLGSGTFCNAENLYDLQAKRASQWEWYTMDQTTNTPVMTVYYVGSATNASVTIAYNAMTAYAPVGTLDSSNFGASGVYDLSASGYDTLGELCTAINKLASYDCVLKGGRTSDNSTYLRDQTQASTLDLKGTSGYDVYPDSGGYTAVTDIPHWVGIYRKPSSSRRVILKECIGYITGTNVVDARLMVYGKLRAWEEAPSADHATRDTRTEAFKSIQVTTGSATTFPFHTYGVGGMEFAVGEPVIVRLMNIGALVPPAAADYLKCYGLEW